MNVCADFFYFFIIGAALLLSVLGLWFTAIIPGFDRWSKRFFMLYFIVLTVTIPDNAAEQLDFPGIGN